jgi:hypothetical protein
MNHLLMSLYVFFMFFVLTPGILLKLPPTGSKITVALVHAAVFALVFHLTHKMVWQTLHPNSC